MLFVLFFIFFYKKAEEAAVSIKHTSVCLDILNHLLNSLTRNVSEEVNAKARKSFLVAQWRGRGGVGVVGSTSSARRMDRGYNVEVESEIDLKKEKEERFDCLDP